MKRIHIGTLELGQLAPGQHRALSPAEVAAFSRALQGDAIPPAPAMPTVRSSTPARAERPHRSVDRARHKRLAPKESR